MSEDDKAYTVRAEIPAVNREGIHVTVEAGLLYTEDTQAGELLRTVSRLTGMRSCKYIPLPYLA